MANEKRLIDADDLLAELKKRHEIVMQDSEISKSMKWCEAVNYGAVTGIVEKLPTIDAAPVVHGRWKYYHKQNMAVCTNCSFERDLDANFGKAVSCPNCGAKMDGGVSDG